jgi:annexin A7/11
MFQYPPCNPDEDARALRTAMKGMGTDEKMMIKILCNRSREQLQQIAYSFKAHHGRELKDEIKKECSGNFRKLLTKRFDPPVVMKAKALNAAMKGAGTNDRRLIDCLAFTANAELPMIKQIYLQKSGKDLMSKLKSETSGHFKDAVLDLSDGNRDERPVDPNQITSDVAKLYKAGEGKVGTDEKAFIKTLCNHAPWYNVALNAAYGHAHKHDLKKAIEKEFSGNLKELLMALCTGPYEYWADRMYYSMKGAGTDDKTLIFLLTFLERNELLLVNQLMKQRHNADLKHMLKGDLTGDYEKAATELTGL